MVSWEELLGMNARNEIIDDLNPAEAVRLANNKYESKQRLEEQGVSVIPTLALLRDRLELQEFDWDELPEAWALKPNFGLGGSGILLAHGEHEDGWVTGSGDVLARDMVLEHVHAILAGEYSMGSMQRDWALFEPLVVAEESVAGLVPHGLPDVRVICLHGEAVLSMARLPTELSDGKANLHQGAVGAGIELDTGKINRAFWEEEEVTHHPDTGVELVGFQMPYWDEIIDASCVSGHASGLGYMGADVVIDEKRGPMVLEVNARPGLGIQNATGKGLAARLEELGRDEEAG